MNDLNRSQLSTKNQELLLIELNKLVNHYAGQTAASISNDNISTDLVYPPGDKLNEQEVIELQKLKNNNLLKSALTKIIADNSANVLLDFLSLADGVSDPETDAWEGDGICIVDLNDNCKGSREMLHDKFFEQYWNWKELKNRS